MKRILLNLSDDLVKAIDNEAYYNSMTRTGMIRRMLISYLRPETTDRTDSSNTHEPANAHQDLYANPDEMLKILQHRRLLAGVRKMLNDAKKERSRRNTDK
jgi:metal-responsive CopG/Arc/MetJ family transcriptional regulator